MVESVDPHFRSLPKHGLSQNNHSTPWVKISRSRKEDPKSVPTPIIYPVEGVGDSSKHPLVTFADDGQRTPLYQGVRDTEVTNKSEESLRDDDRW